MKILQNYDILYAWVWIVENHDQDYIHANFIKLANSELHCL